MPSEKITSLVKIMRPENAVGSAMTYLAGYYFATNQASIDLVVGLVILLLLHSYATLQNDIEDYEIDKSNHRDGVIQAGGLSLNRAKAACNLLIFGALTLAVLLNQTRLHMIVIFGSILLAGAYNLNPARVSKRPLSSIILLGLCYGALPLIYGFLLGGGKVSAGFVFIACLFFIARASTSVLKDYKDAKGDRQHNKMTFYLIYGGKITAWFSIAGAAIAYICLILVLLINRDKSMIYFLALALAVYLALSSVITRSKLADTKDEKKLNKLFREIFVRHNQFEGAMVLCLILSSK